MALDLTTETGIRHYFNSTPKWGPISRVQTLEGGSANFVFRVFLENPLHIDGVALETVIAKHGQPYVKTMTQFPLPLERQAFEVQGLQYAKQLSSLDSLVVAPLVIQHDVENAVIITSDGGVSSRTLKDLFLQNALSPDAAASIGTELGSFLGRFHSYGRGGSDFRAVFAKHDWSRMITALIYHGKVNEVLKGDTFDPPIAIDEETQRCLDSALEEMTDLVRNAQETIVVGDFWTGNVLVDLASQKEDKPAKVTVIDWEMVKIGFSANDVGQFAAEVALPYAYQPECSGAAEAFMSSFCSSYRSSYPEFDPDCAAKAAMHIGSHLISVASHAPPWGGKPGFTRNMAEKGIQYLCRGYKRDWGWIASETLLGGLCPK